MKPAPFDYVAPDNIDEVLSVLAQYGDEAKVIAGGQTLGPMLNMRVVTPTLLVDINRIEALQAMSRSDSGLVLGALTRQSSLEDDDDLNQYQPLIAAAIPHIAHRAIRNRGTVGGSLCHADPAAEWGALAHVLDATLVIARQGAELRTVPATEFFQGLLATALQPEELLVEVRLPAWPKAAGWSFQEFSRRHGDFALAGVACHLAVDGASRCTAGRLGLIGVGDRPLRAGAAEKMLLGEPAGEPLFRAVAARAAAETDPMNDLHASAAYRRHLVEVLTFDALMEAWSKCVRH
jgi:carbon-monoxide dehydrogenase medium subunit